VLRYGDFGTGNILYDPQTLTISGIIDFGFAGLGDGALDELDKLRDSAFIDDVLFAIFLGAVGRTAAGSYARGR